MSEKYFVINENTLARLIDSGISGFQTLAVVAASVIRGSINHFGDNIVATPLDKVRPATKKDFEDYRVDSTGLLED